MKKLKAIRLNDELPAIQDDRISWEATGVYSKFIHKDEYINLSEYYDLYDDLFEGLESLSQVGYVYYFVEKDLYILFNQPVDKVFAEKEYKKIKDKII
ncbi:hypothetical protein [Fusobacterium sp. THCT1E2]